MLPILKFSALRRQLYHKSLGLQFIQNPQVRLEKLILKFQICSGAFFENKSTFSKSSSKVSGLFVWVKIVGGTLVKAEIP